VQEEQATEEMQKLGGMEALDEPYATIPLFKMLRKRALWLIILFFSEMLTATAMGRYQDEIGRAVVLAIFLPLIMSSGGNSGSQATTLIIRALALGEVRLRDWFKIMRRELTTGLLLGVMLGVLGCLRIYLWQGLHPVYPAFFMDYGAHFVLIGIAVGLALVGVVMWGSVCGAMLPFLLKRCGLDPATSSAPFVATLVDVTGLIIYFNTAMLILRGTVL